MAGRPQEIDTALGRGSMNRRECLWKGKKCVFQYRSCIFNELNQSKQQEEQQGGLETHCCRSEIRAHTARKWKCWMWRSLGLCYSESRESQSEWSHSRWERCSSQWESVWSGSAPCLGEVSGWLNFDLFKEADTEPRFHGWLVLNTRYVLRFVRQLQSTVTVTRGLIQQHLCIHFFLNGFPHILHECIENSLGKEN